MTQNVLVAEETVWIDMLKQSSEVLETRVDRLEGIRPYLMSFCPVRAPSMTGDYLLKAAE